MPKVFRIDDFSGGEFGDLGAQGAARNQFSGSNVMVYQDGTIGPRPGVKTLVTNTNTATGTVWAFRGGQNAGANNAAFGLRNCLWQVPVATITTTIVVVPPTAGVSTTATIASQLIQYGSDKALLTRYQDKVYVISEAAGIVHAPGSPGCMTVTPYGVRVMVANGGITTTATVSTTTDTSHRVYYSAAADPTSWPVLNYFDVGNAKWPVQYIDEIRQRLAISNEGGEWWALTGTPGVNDSLKRQPRGDLSPLKWYHAARTAENLWFFPQGEDFPVQFTGIVVGKLRYRHLKFTGGTGTDYGMTSLPVAEVVLATENGGSNRGLMLANDVWTFHTFGVTTSKFLSPATTGGPEADLQTPLLLCDGGGAATPKIHTFIPTLDRPGKVSDLLVQPGDNTTVPLTAYVYTAALQADVGKELWAREIRVEGFKWNHGNAATNHFDLVVRSYMRYNLSGTKDSKTFSFDEAASATTSDKTPFVQVFRAGDQQYGDSVQVRISALRGIAIRSIEVVCDERDVR